MPEPASRRTVVIRGQVVDRYSPPRTQGFPARGGARRRRSVHTHAGRKPDRIALWAVLLGIVLVLVAATSAHGAVAHLAHPAIGNVAAPAGLAR